MSFRFKLNPAKTGAVPHAPHRGPQHLRPAEADGGIARPAAQKYQFKIGRNGMSLSSMTFTTPT